MKNPNYFSSETRQALAKRAGYLCSNPHCQAKTIGPHNDERKSTNLGEAAHIRGAKPGSARFNENMTPEERKVITNGIWLCRKCSKLIDSNPKDFTVERLYKWKSEHEEKIYSELSGNPLDIETKERIKTLFTQDSPAALQIALDKPDYWEFLLTVELLRSNFEKINSLFIDFKLGLLFKPHKVIKKTDFINWFRAKLFDLEAIVRAFKVVTEIKLQTAWGEKGVPGDAAEIRKACFITIEKCNELVNWELDVQSTIFPEELEEYKREMIGWTEVFISELNRIPKELAKIFQIDKPKGDYSIDLTFRAPSNLDALTKKIIMVFENKNLI